MSLLVDALAALVYLVCPAADPPRLAAPPPDEPYDVELRLPLSRLYWLLVAAGMETAADPDDLDPERAAAAVLLEIELRGIERLARPTERSQ